MPRSLGNKRNKIGGAETTEPQQIQEITRIHGNFVDGDTRTLPVDGVEKALVVSGIFDNEDFGYRKITVERPLRLSFQVTPERIARLEDEPGFRNLASSNRKAEDARLVEIELGQRRQDQIRGLLRAFAASHEGRRWGDRATFLADLRAAVPRLTAPELKAIVSALGERDECAEICRDRHGRPEPDPELRDTESVPLKENVDEFFAREVLPHVPDAWVDHAKTKIGYEIPFNRHFYRYEPPRPLAEIEAEIRALETEIVALLAEVTA